MLSKQRGSTIVETAITLNVLFLLLFAILGFGFIFYDYQSLTDAAREGARYAVVYANTPSPPQIAQHLCSFLTAGAAPANCTRPQLLTTTCVVSGGAFPANGQSEGVYISPNCSVAQPNNVTLTYTEIDILKNVKLPILPNIPLHVSAAMRNETN